VRITVRKLVGVAVVAMLAAFVATPMVAASAGTMPGVGPPSPGFCNFTVDNTNFPNVVISGSTPVGADVVVEIRFQADGSPTAVLINTQHLAGGGDFSFAYNTGGAAGDVTVNYTYGNKNAYVTGCTGPGGVTVVRAEAINKGGTSPQKALAVTGSNNTPSFVLIGLAALVLGFVFVMAARRRSQVNS
jgi:LPXTG-motif cell wall-anchored protein